MFLTWIFDFRVPTNISRFRSNDPVSYIPILPISLLFSVLPFRFLFEKKNENKNGRGFLRLFSSLRRCPNQGFKFWNCYVCRGHRNYRNFRNIGNFEFFWLKLFEILTDIEWIWIKYDQIHKKMQKTEKFERDMSLPVVGRGEKFRKIWNEISNPGPDKTSINFFNMSKESNRFRYIHSTNKEQPGKSAKETFKVEIQDNFTQRADLSIRQGESIEPATSLRPLSPPHPQDPLPPYSSYWLSK